MLLQNVLRNIRQFRWSVRIMPTAQTALHPIILDAEPKHQSIIVSVHDEFSVDRLCQQEEL